MAEHETKQEELEEKITKLQEQGKTDMENLIKELSSSMRAMNNRTLSTWDITTKNQSIKAHIKSVENMAKRLNWSDTEKASELMLSLRGEAKNIADSLPNDIQSDYRTLKEELLNLLYTEKPKSQILDEFYNYNWRPERQSIPQYAAILRNKLRKMNEDKPTHENDIFLRSRLLQGIKNRYPEFGEKLELMDLDEKDVNELANFAQRKFDVYRLNNDVREENFAALIADKENNKKAEPNPKTKKNRQAMQDETGMHANSLPYKRHYENHNVSWEDNQDSMLSRERMYRQKDPRFRHGFGAPWEEYKYPDINTGRETYRPRNRPPYQEFRTRDWEQQFQQIPQQFHNRRVGIQRGPERFQYQKQQYGQKYGQRWPDEMNINMEHERNPQPPYADYERSPRRRLWMENGKRSQIPYPNNQKYQNHFDRGTTIRRNDRVEYLKEKDQEKN